MTRVTTDFGGHYKVTRDFRADVPMKTKPTIVKSRKIKGVEHYVGADKKLFVSSIFNKIWGMPKIA